MSGNITKELQKAMKRLQRFQTKLKEVEDRPDRVEELVGAEVSNLWKPVDPIQRVRIPAAPEIRLPFSIPGRQREASRIEASPHEAGLFLLPYAPAFRERFIERFETAIFPVKRLMQRLRDLEMRYHQKAKAREGGNAGKSQTAKEEWERLAYDYNFFKYLHTVVLDNSKLGRLFTEIGSLLGGGSLQNQGIVGFLKIAQSEARISGTLSAALAAFDRIAPLCANMYLSSIASWASLSNFISAEAKTLEREMLDKAGPENYRPEYLAFRETIKRITQGLSGAPTPMQEKALYYAYGSFQAHLSEKRDHPFRLNNFAQVGAGKTYTTPIFLKMFSHLIHQKWTKRRRPPIKLLTLYFTEANLGRNVINSMIEIGVPEKRLHQIQMKTLPTLAVQEGDCVVLSRHEFGLKGEEEITYPLEILIRRGFHFMIVSDESSFLKNSESGISSAMETLYGYLKKRRVLWVDYRLSATPANNDTGDFLYLLATNRINIGSFLYACPDIAERMGRTLAESYYCDSDLGGLSLHRLLPLLTAGGSRTGVLVSLNLIESSKEGSETVDEEEGEKSSGKRMHELIYTDCAGAVLSLFYQAVLQSRLFPIKPWLGSDKEGREIQPGLIDVLHKLGIGYTRLLQPMEEKVRVLTGLEKPLVHPGSRELDALVPCLLLLKEMTPALTYDRALNADEEVHFHINAKQLDSNLLESVTNLEVLEKIGQFLNLIMFVNLVRKVRSCDRAWWAVGEEIETEFRRLRLEFLAAYAHLRGVPLIPMQETVTRKVHKGFQIVEETETHPYLAARPDQKKDLIGLLQVLSFDGILGHRLMDDLAQFFAPVRYFELLNFLEGQEGKTQAERERREEEIEKKRVAIIETLVDALGIQSERQTFPDLIALLEKDLNQTGTEKDHLVHFRPSILAKYPLFLTRTLEALRCVKEEQKGAEAQRLHDVIREIGSENVDLAQTLAEYGIIFKASESVNFPLVLRFADRIVQRLSALLAERGIKLEIREGDIDRVRKVISRCASFENYAGKMAELARAHQTPLLVSCRYRFSQKSLLSTTAALFSVTGETEKSDRYKILGDFDRLDEEMGRVLVATTKSILKGFNLFYTQYGFMSEGMDNAEVRLQMAGRLRPLFPQHLKEIERVEKVLMKVKPASPVIQHLRRLKENVKIFDVVSPRMISGFPDIQNGKAFMLNTFLFSQIHQRSFPEIFTDEEVFHYIDSRPTFNAKTVEGFCKKAIEEAMESYPGKLKGKEGITIPELIELMEREIQLAAERNARLSSYYELLGREKGLGR